MIGMEAAVLCGAATALLAAIAVARWLAPPRVDTGSELAQPGRVGTRALAGARSEVGC